MVDELTKIATDGEPIIGMMISGTPSGKPRIDFPPNQDMSNPEIAAGAFSLVDKAYNRFANEYREGGKIHVENLYKKSPPDLTTAFGHLEEFRGKHDIAKEKGNPAGMLLALGGAAAAKEKLDKIVKERAPVTALTIGGLIGGSLLINHLVKKYRDSQNQPKKGKR